MQDGAGRLAADESAPLCAKPIQWNSKLADWARWSRSALAPRQRSDSTPRAMPGRWGRFPGGPAVRRCCRLQSPPSSVAAQRKSYRSLPKLMLISLLRLRSQPQFSRLCQSYICTTFFLAQDLVAFSALCILSRSRNFIRALCNWDLLLPIEHPTIVAISLCSYPSTS